MTHKIDTVIFDLDGTLLNTLTDLTNSVNYALEQYQLPTHSEDAVRRMVGNGIYVLFEKAIPDGRNFPEYDNCVKTFQKHYELHKKDFTRPFPGIMDLLKQLSTQNYKLAIVSNKFDQAVKELCKDFFTPYISTAIGESKEIARKPAPDTVFQAMNELGSAPETCVYIGDSDVDIATANNSGIPCISVTWGFRDQDFLIQHGGTCFANSATDIIDILSKWS